MRNAKNRKDVKKQKEKKAKKIRSRQGKARRGGSGRGKEERGTKVKENLQCLQGEEQHQTLGCRVSLAAEILWLYYCSTGRAGLVLG